MTLFGRKRPVIATKRLDLRLPELGDYEEWTRLRRESSEFLSKWEPIRPAKYYSRTSFRNRSYWARRTFREKQALALVLVRREDGALLGGITLDNVRYGAAMAGSVGYWMGEKYARQGYMEEALRAVVEYAFEVFGISRIEAGCLPENEPSRSLLEKAGFKYEGVAQSYLQIAGRWRNHVLYANLRRDRRGRSDAGADAE